jgi:uncharacterized protein (TIGR02611 family)
MKKQAIGTLRKIVVLCVGLPLLVLGIVLMVLPGPGLLVIAISLIILAAEFPSAKYLLDRGKQELTKLRQRWSK